MIQDNIMIQDGCALIHNECIETMYVAEQKHVQSGQFITMNLHHQEIQQFQQHHQNLQQQQVLQSTVFYHPNAHLSHDNIFTGANETLIDANKMNSDLPVEDIINTSHASTVEDPLNENEVPREDAFTYLQGLNSDNLMQFSQQSALQELMNEQMAIKPNLDVLPTFEEHDIGGYKFKLNFDSQRKGKVSWIYSPVMNKVYLRMNDILNVEASYTPKIPLQLLRIRVLICFTKEVSEPVLRCQNHLSTDTECNQKIRRSILRCENPTADYRGRCKGKSINERLSVVIPLSSATKPTANSTQKQTIALKFTCQNSCIGRKETCLIFLLESINGEILSQTVLDVKICSCPKRDKAVDEKNAELPKRKMEEDLYPCKKKMKRSEKYNMSAVVKKECAESETDENSSDSSNSRKHCDLQRTPSGHFRVVMEVPTKEIAVHAIECCFNKTICEMFKNPNHSNRFSRDCQKLKKLYYDALKL